MIKLKQSIFYYYHLFLVVILVGCGYIIENENRDIQISKTATITEPATEMVEIERNLSSLDLSCDKVCFYDIIPGKTSWEEASLVLEDYGIRSLERNWVYRDLYSHFLPNFRLSSVEEHVDRLNIVETDGIVKGVVINSGGYKDKQEFVRIWEDFSPNSLLGTVGEPTRIWLELVPPADGRAQYYIWFFYDDIGLLVRYVGLIEEPGDVLVCFEYESSNILAIGIQVMLVEPGYMGLDEFHDIIYHYPIDERSNQNNNYREIIDIEEEILFGDILSTDKDACYFVYNWFTGN